MHAVGRLLPRGDRAPAIEPVATRALARRIAAAPALAGWRLGRSSRVARGFYISQALELASGMSVYADVVLGGWKRIGTRFLPFADVASTELPLGRLLRLALFQVSVGMATALLVGTLNRVMIVELSVSASLVALMVALPILFAPFRALVGFRSDTHRSFLGWRRVPYLWIGTLLQFGGLAIMPFALIVLSGDANGPAWIGHAGAALAFLLVGAGMQTTQTAGLALATDLAPVEARPRVVALMYVMLLLGMVAGGTVFGLLLSDFSQIRLIQVVQGAALATMVLNLLALWKQEARDPARAEGPPAASAVRRGLARVRRASPAASASSSRSGSAPPASHAGHRARALRRAGAGTLRRRDDRADRADGGRRARGVRARRAAARPRRRPAPRRRLRRAGRHRRVRVRGVRRAARLGRAVPRRHAG